MNAFSLFSNAGIGDIGVENAGVKVLFANELLKRRAETYSHNHKHTKVLQKDINQITKEEWLTYKKELLGENELDLLIATPPCQGASVAGKRDKKDIRNQLIKPAMNAIQILNPRWVWIENVVTYANATIPNVEEVVEDDDTFERKTIREYIKEKSEKCGYKMIEAVLNAKDYGVPQSRRRWIVIITREDVALTMPKRTNGEGLAPYRTVRDAIGGLEPLDANEKSKKDDYHFSPKHNERHIKWIKATPEGMSAHQNKRMEDRPNTIDKVTGERRPIKGYDTTYKRMYWDQPAKTVTIYSASLSSQCNGHPRDPRAMTVREIMELQTIPNTYRFLEDASHKEMREIIGEAVPCLLAERITKHILELDKKGK